MKESRYRELTDNRSAILTQEEIAAGWHFCSDWDQMLVGPGMREFAVCACDIPATAEHSRALAVSEERDRQTAEPTPQEKE